jgi:GNAT superfamily N-acetyltransferase
MSAAVEYSTNKATAAQIAAHLSDGDADFVPPLSSRIEIGSYANKICNNAVRFEAWSGGMLIGLVAAYCNDNEARIAYITSVSVLKKWTGKGIAASLLKQCVAHANASGMRLIRLEVSENNAPAIRLYEKMGFVADRSCQPSGSRQFCLAIGE